MALAAALAPGARLLLGPTPFAGESEPVVAQAAARGVPHERVAPLRKHWNPLRTGASASAIAPLAARHAPAVVIVHLDAEHAAARAALPAAAAPAAILRCVHERGRHAWRTRRLLREAELLATPTLGLARELEEELRLPRASVGVIETSVARDRFRFHAVVGVVYGGTGTSSHP